MNYKIKFTFTTKKALRTYVREAQNHCMTPIEFEEWLNKNAGKLYVMDDKEPYTASELAELV